MSISDTSLSGEDRLATALRYAVSVIVSYGVDTQSLPVKYRKPFVSPLYQRVWDDLLMLLDGADPYTDKSTLELVRREVARLKEAERIVQKEIRQHGD